MADAAVGRGYSYVAITDHSKGLTIAGGINEDQLAHGLQIMQARAQEMGLPR